MANSQAPDLLLGRTFGQYRVREYAGKSKNGTHLWLCVCTCGTQTKVRQGRLLHGETAKCKWCSRTKHGQSYTCEYALFVGAKHRAKKYGFAFNLELADVAIPDLCPCLGIPIEKWNWLDRYPSHKSRTGSTYQLNDRSPSLDRVDPDKGYVKGNVWVISARANRIKNNSSPEELRKIAAAVESRQEGTHGQ